MSEQPRTFRIEQLGPPRGRGAQINEPVTDLESMVTHHPGANRNAHMRTGQIRGVEDLLPTYRGGDRSYAYIDGEYQEVIDRSTDRYGSLKPDQVLVVKDFILEDPSPARGTNERAVGVPSPTDGYVSRVVASGGMVEIMDRQGGEVIARIRHMNPIAVQAGDTVAYGQSLGTQHRQGLRPNVGIHVHIEMDTKHHQELANYIDDLSSGRLPVQPELRPSTARPVIDDGTFRLGQSNERIRDLQRVMASEGYRSVHGGPLDQDGVYRPSMQGALLDFQRAHGLSQTGDIDPATLGLAPPASRREADRHDHTAPGQAPHAPAQERHAPGHPDHPDHRQNLPDRLPPPVNQPAPGRRGPADRDHPDHAMLEQIREGIRRIDAGIGKPYDETSERLGRCLLPECKDRGLKRVDHVVMGRDGTNLFAIQGPLTDPVLQRAHVSTEQAIRTPVEQSDDRLLAINQSIAQEQKLAQQQELSRGPEDPNRAGLAMR